jgi:hypothetical protein
MLAQLHRTSPGARVTTSTNGIPLSNLDRARKVVAAGALDFMMFTISGVTQETYSRYHVGGRLELALRGMANVLQAKRELGLTKPIVHWRYLVFNWNDSEAEIEAALRLKEEYGIDEFSLHLTHVPLSAMSFRFSPGTPSFTRYRQYINNALGYTRYMPSPDADGFYEREDSSLGKARWSGWQARKTLKVRRNRATLSVSTHRPARPGGADHVFILTPWQKFKVPLKPGAWRKVELNIPVELKLDEVEVEIVTLDHWFPAEEGTADQRCLGVLVQEGNRNSSYLLSTRRSYASISEKDAEMIANFKYRAPEPLTDW